MADRGERMGAGGDERMGRRVHEGLDGGVSRRASMKGSSRSEHEEPDDDRDAGHGGEFGATDDGSGERGAEPSGGYGASSGFADEKQRDKEEEPEHLDRHEGGAELEPGATEARTRTDDVGRQAESGIETWPEEGTRRDR